MSSTPSVAQLLSRSSQFSWRSMAITLSIVLVLLIIAFVISGDFLFALIVACVPLLVLAVQICLRWWYARRLEYLLNAQGTLIWNYTDEEWEEFREVTRQRFEQIVKAKFDRRYILIALGLGTLTFGGLLGSLISLESIETVPVLIGCLVFGVIVSFAFYFACVGTVLLERIRIRRLDGMLRIAVLGTEGLSFRHWTVLWDRSTVVLFDAAVAQYEHSYSELVLSVSVLHASPVSGIGSSSTRVRNQFRIPIPKGRENDARDYVSRLTSK